MKYLILLLVAFTCLLSINACKSKIKKHTFGTDALETLAFHIATDRDTTIITKNGALLDIPKGTLDAGNSKFADLEIKEAFTLDQIIMGGLTTTSNGIPLSSGGMIYVNAKAGQTVSILKPIRVAIPANYLQKGMQLYKGEVGKDGAVNWKDPADLPESQQKSIYDEGKLLYENNCASCHKLGQEATGPDLAHYLKIFGPIRQEGFPGYAIHYPYQQLLNEGYEVKEDTVRLIDTSRYEPKSKLAFAGEIYQCNLIRMYGSLGPRYDLTNEQFNKLYSYIQQESDRLNLPLPFLASIKLSADSCMVYRKMTGELQEEKAKISRQRDNQIKENGKQVIINPDSLQITTNQKISNPVIAPAPKFREVVTPNNYDAVYYQFTISSFGWYNIDMMMKMLDGVQESELFVRIRGQYQQKINVFLIIPSVKVYAEGGPSEKDPAAFAFFYKDGKLPLPQNAKAYILAITETEENLAYGVTAFTTGLKQDLTVTLQGSTKEAFKLAMAEWDLARLHISVSDSKNADSIRKEDAQLKDIEAKLQAFEKWKPKLCDCNCGGAAPDSNSKNP